MINTNNKSWQLFITNKQLEILLFLYRFRFLTTSQIQKLFHDKRPRVVQRLLKDLVQKRYIHSNYSRQVFAKNTKPAVFSLLPKSREILKDQSKCDIYELGRLYKERERTEFFIEHSLFIADLYLTFKSQASKKEPVYFSTKADLSGYTYFPSPAPDAFISIKEKEATRHFFLFLIDENMSLSKIKARIKNFFMYARTNNWEKGTGYQTEPQYLIICPNDYIKRRVYTYISNSIPLESYYLTTKETIKQKGLTPDIWQKVE